jgi:hypothetical protein
VKITKSQLKQLIKEELQSIKEQEVQDPLNPSRSTKLDPEQATDPDAPMSRMGPEQMAAVSSAPEVKKALQQIRNHVNMMEKTVDLKLKGRGVGPDHARRMSYLMQLLSKLVNEDLRDAIHSGNVGLFDDVIGYNR